jgi:excisionase family DNA binding protein
MTTNHEFRKNVTAQEISQIVQKALEQVSQLPDQKIYNTEQLCNYLGVSKRTVAEWRKQGLITYHKIGAIIYYTHADVEEMLSRFTVEAIPNKIRVGK